MNIVIDIETTGVLPGCCILSIAAVPIISDIIPFYVKIKHSSAIEAGLVDDIETMKWWEGDLRREAKIEAFSGTTEIKAALDSLTKYLNLFKNVFLWSQGKDFDFPILKYAYEKLSRKFPIHHYNLRCLRDLMSYTGNTYPDRLGVHNALKDAEGGARMLKVIVDKNKMNNDFYLPE